MKKCEVVVDAISIVAGQGSVVIVSEEQYKLVKHALKPLEEKKAVVETQVDAQLEQVEVREEKPKKTTRKKSQ